jgi:hypothetical protein
MSAIADDEKIESITKHKFLTSVDIGIRFLYPLLNSLICSSKCFPYSAATALAISDPQSVAAPVFVAAAFRQ